MAAHELIMARFQQQPRPYRFRMAQPANMSDIHIRPGVEDDIPVILALIHGLPSMRKRAPKRCP